MVEKFVKDTAKALDEGTVPEWISAHVATYRESAGETGHHWDSSAVGGTGMQTCLLLTTVGRKSGRSTTHPLLYGKDEADFIIVGSKGGSDSHPHWYFNLVANPEVVFQVGSAEFKARATLVTGAARERLWALITDIFPPYRDYQARTSRLLPLFSLARIAEI